MLAPETVIRRGTNHVETEIVDQTMMMSIDQGKYFALEGTAKSIWARLVAPRSVQNLVDELTNDYDVEADQCMSDVMTFLTEMMENELVVVETET